MSAPLDMDMCGQRLGGRYRVVRLLGRGGMGAVYEATQEDLRRSVALKLMHPDVARDPSLVERFRAEAQAAAAIGHPNITQVFDFRADPPEPPYIVMELLAGLSFRELIAKMGCLEPTRVAFIGAQVLSALSAAHSRGIIHRDVKPANVFICTSSAIPDLAKVLDFGVAKLLGQDAPESVEGSVVGTMDYMAPEQARGEQVDGRADVYSVGAMLYHALAGRKPLVAPTMGELIRAIFFEQPPPLAAARPDIPRELADIVERALAKHAESRFASAEEMQAALMRLTPVRKGGSPPETSGARTAPEESRGDPLTGPTGAVAPVTITGAEHTHASYTYPPATRASPGAAALGPRGGTQVSGGPATQLSAGPSTQVSAGPATALSPAPHAPAPYAPPPYAPTPSAPPPAALAQPSYAPGAYAPAPYAPPPYQSGPAPFPPPAASSSGAGSVVVPLLAGAGVLVLLFALAGIIAAITVKRSAGAYNAERDRALGLALAGLPALKLTPIGVGVGQVDGDGVEDFVVPAFELSSPRSHVVAFSGKSFRPLWMSAQLEPGPLDIVGPVVLLRRDHPEGLTTLDARTGALRGTLTLGDSAHEIFPSPSSPGAACAYFGATKMLQLDPLALTAPVPATEATCPFPVLPVTRSSFDDASEIRTDGVHAVFVRKSHRGEQHALVGLEPRTLAPRWSTPITQKLGPLPKILLAGGTVFVETEMMADDAFILAFDASTGKPRFTIGPGRNGLRAATATRLYVATGDVIEGQAVTVFDAKTGAKLGATEPMMTFPPAAQ